MNQVDDFNSADRKKVEEKKSIDKRLQKQLMADIRKVTDTKEGRRFLWHLLSEYKIYQISFTGNSHTFFNEGIRQAGLKLLTLIMEADAEVYPKMLKENNITEQ